MELWQATIHDHREHVEDEPEILIGLRPFVDCHTVAHNYLHRRAVAVFGSSRDTTITDTDEGNGLWSVTLRGPYGSVVGLVGIARVERK
jgi:hypothetical protein